MACFGETGENALFPPKKPPYLEQVFKKMWSIEIVALSVRPSIPYFFHISAPRKLKISI
jgi:hypothetical protein